MFTSPGEGCSVPGRSGPDLTLGRPSSTRAAETGNKKRVSVGRYIYIYIYICILCVKLYFDMYTFICVHMDMCIYIYIYIYIEREREGEMETPRTYAVQSFYTIGANGFVHKLSRAVRRNKQEKTYGEYPY